MLFLLFLTHYGAGVCGVCGENNKRSDGYRCHNYGMFVSCMYIIIA